MTKTSRIAIERLSSVDDLERLRDEWNTLARGIPFRGYEWLESWWQNYGESPAQELLVLAALDSTGLVVGLAPWYLDRSAAKRNVIRFLGSGEVGADYSTVLCQPGWEESVALALADWLCAAPEQASADQPDWELVELSGASEHDFTVRRLVEHLAARGNLVHKRSRSSCWQVSLPADWEEFLAMLSKSHRKQIRELEKTYFETGRARLFTVATTRELSHGLEVLERLHQMRWESLGKRGCFASARFAAFHTQTAARLLHTGDLRLVWLEVDGRTIAADYQVLGNGVVYADQFGMDPRALDLEPGKLITLATMRQAVAEGRHAFDFLRGDESCEAYWRAHSRTTLDIRVVVNTPGARLRHGFWLAGDHMKRWVKKSLQLPAAVHR